MVISFNLNKYKFISAMAPVNNTYSYVDNRQLYLQSDKHHHYTESNFKELINVFAADENINLLQIMYGVLRLYSYGTALYVPILTMVYIMYVMIIIIKIIDYKLRVKNNPKAETDLVNTAGLFISFFAGLNQLSSEKIYSSTANRSLYNILTKFYVSAPVYILMSFVINDRLQQIATSAKRSPFLDILWFILSFIVIVYFEMLNWKYPAIFQENRRRLKESKNFHKNQNRRKLKESKNFHKNQPDSGVSEKLFWLLLIVVIRWWVSKFPKDAKFSLRRPPTIFKRIQTSKIFKKLLDLKNFKRKQNIKNKLKQSLNLKKAFTRKKSRKTRLKIALLIYCLSFGKTIL